MSLKYDQYLSLIRDLEARAEKNKKFYETKVLLLIVLGYGYFVGLIVLFFVPILTLGLGLIMAPEAVLGLLLPLGKILWLIIPGIGIYLGFLGSAIKSITAKVPDPEGTQLQRNDAPELFDFVAATSKRLKARLPRKILINDEFNAAVVTMPRFGIFGRKVILMIGLPLMRALSRKQLEAVIAHEIGHISGKHGSFAKWAYQMREAWGRLIESQEVQKYSLSALYETFVNWYFPYFNAYSFVLMREHEKDADRAAADIVGPVELGEALILLDTKNRSLTEDFWVSLHKENIETDVPTEKIFTRMLSSLSFTDPDRDRVSLEKAVAVPTDFLDTHPSLADRLRLIGYWSDGELPRMPEAVEVDAASALIGPLGTKLASEFDMTWDHEAAKMWKKRHDHFRKSQERVAELKEKLGSEEITFEELREIGRLTYESDGVAAAMPIFEEAARRFPDESVSWFNLGLGRIQLDDEAGLADLEKAASMDRSLEYEANQLAFSYLRQKGRLDDASKYAEAIHAQEKVYEKANEERKSLDEGDEIGPHDLTQGYIDLLPKKLAGLDEIDAVYAANKLVALMPEYPCRALFIALRPKQRGDSDASTILEIVMRQIGTDDIHHYIILDDKRVATLDQLVRIPGAKIFERARGK